jgi:hypothetical protein
MNIKTLKLTSYAFWLSILNSGLLVLFKKNAAISEYSYILFYILAFLCFLAKWHKFIQQVARNFGYFVCIAMLVSIIKSFNASSSFGSKILFSFSLISASTISYILANIIKNENNNK